MFALRTEDGIRGTYASFYGPGIDDGDAAIVAHLRVPS